MSQVVRFPDDVYPLRWISMVYPWIYQVYSMYIGEDGIYMEYAEYIPGIYRKSRFVMGLPTDGRRCPGPRAGPGELLTAMLRI
jgi:hypothetical protein